MKRYITYIVLGLLALLPLLGLSSYAMHILILVIMWSVIGMAWNLLSGYCGQVSFGHAAFFGAGAYTAGMLYSKLGWSGWWGFPASVIVVSAFALAIGYICLGLRGPYFALATLKGQRPLVDKKPMKGNPMLNEQTFDKLYALKLIGMLEGFKEQLEEFSFRDLSFEERFGMLVERQWNWKENKRLSRLLQEAKLKLQACIEDIDYRTPRGIEKSVILGLASCDWIRNHQNILISGPTGVGKTFLG